MQGRSSTRMCKRGPAFILVTFLAFHSWCVAFLPYKQNRKLLLACFLAATVSRAIYGLASRGDIRIERAGVGVALPGAHASVAPHRVVSLRIVRIIARIAAIIVTELLRRQRGGQKPLD